MDGNDYLSHIKGVRSIRFFQDKEVSDELVKKIVECAAYAPSTHNSEPWRYYIVSSDKDKKLLRENRAFKQSFVYHAPVIIISTINPDEKGCLSQNTFRCFENWNYDRRIAMAQDEAIAMQVMHEAASAFGLGSCIIGLMNSNKVKEILNIPQKNETNLALALGYLALESRHTKFKSPEELIITSTINKI